MQTVETHQFSDTEVARALYPWGLVEHVDPEPFDIDRCVEQYMGGLPRRAKTDAHPWRDDFTRKLSGKRGVVTDDEAKFWFVALTDPRRLDDDRDQQTTVAALRDFDATAPIDVHERFSAYVAAFEARYRNVRFYSQAYLARLMLQISGLQAALDVVLDVLDVQWIASFLDELFPLGDEDPSKLAALATTWSANAKLASPHTNRPRHDVAVTNVELRLLPLARPQAAIRSFLQAARNNPPRSETALYHVLNAEPDDAAFLDYLESYKPDIGRREVVLLVGRLGFEACDWITKRVRASRGEPSEGLVGALAKVRSHRVVPALLHLAEHPTTANEAREALEDLDLQYAIGLVQAAAGRSKSRDFAAELLAALEQRDPELYTAALAAQPERVADSIAERVSASVVERRPELDEERWPNWMHDLARGGRPPGFPRFCAASRFRPLRLADGEHEVPVAVIWGLLEQLRDRDWSEHKTAIGANIRVDLDGQSASEFFWELFAAWTRNGFPKKYDWCMYAVSEFGTDAQILEFATALEEWPAIAERQRAYDGLHVLELHGSDTALAALNRIAKTSKFKGLRSAAGYALTRLATRSGITPGQLEDMIIDDCGLEPDGSAMFDYGPRQFELVFSPELEPVVRSSEGGITKSLPRPRKSDDPALVAEEKQRFKTMKKRLSDVLKLQARRLETALGEARRWKADAWLEQYVSHPVMTHIVQRFVWSEVDSSGRPTRWFRVTAERTLAGVDDEDLELGVGARVSLAHPVDMPDIEAWGAVFGDYEIIPPFPQLDREIYRPPHRGNYVTTFADVEIAPGWLRGHFNRRGWSKSAPFEGVMTSVYRDFHSAELRVYAELSPGLDLNYRQDAEQRIIEVRFVGRDGRRETGPLRLQDVNPLVYSEALYDLHKLVDRAREDH